MENPDDPPSLNPNKKGRITQLFVDVQICEKFGIDPLKYIVGDSASWSEYPHLKYVLTAYRQLINIEEDRRYQEIESRNKKQ